MKVNKFRKRIFEILEKGRETDLPSLIFDYFIISLIVLNVTAIILESIAPIRAVLSHFFSVFEVVSVIIFTIEYILRVWTSDFKVKAKSKLVSRIKYVFSFMALIDLLAILPFYLPFLIAFDLRFLRILRLSRLLRLFKIQRYSQSLNLIGKVLREKKTDLVVTLFITFILLVFSSTLMYYIESDVQPDEFPNIISTFWWAIATLTTIGYGDVYPITGWGKFLSAVIAILGIGLVALPTGILSSGFISELNIKRKKKSEADLTNVIKYCPHCGKKINIKNP